MSEAINKDIEIKKSILSTMAFFDIFDYPLTSWEIWKFLYRNKAEFIDVLHELGAMESERIINSEKGFYFFPHRSDIVRIRHARYIFAEKKYKKACFAAKIIAVLPCVNAIFVCNSLGYSNSRNDSDIDFFIISRRNRLWVTRFFAVFVTHLSGMRRHGNKVNNRICLSFYASSDALSMENILLSGEDIYFYYWLSTLYPLYGYFDNTEKVFTSNTWQNAILPNIFPVVPSPRRRADMGRMSDFARYMLSKLLNGNFGNFIEHVTKKLQMRRLMNFAQANSDKRGVIISDSILKLHVIDRRQKFKKIWLEKVSLFN